MDLVAEVLDEPERDPRRQPVGRASATLRPMNRPERLAAIMERVAERGNVDVEDLTHDLDVSSATALARICSCDTLHGLITSAGAATEERDAIAALGVEVEVV